MFNNISWQAYWIAIALLTTGYYLVIYFFYFKKDVSVPWKGRVMSDDESPFSSNAVDSAASQPAVIEQPFPFPHFGDFQRPDADTIEGIVYTCLDEVAAYLEEAKRSKCVKEELLGALRSIFRKYPAIAASEYKESVTTVLVNQCEYVCSVHLSAEEVMGVWVEG